MVYWYDRINTDETASEFKSAMKLTKRHKMQSCLDTETVNANINLVCNMPFQAKPNISTQMIKLQTIMLYCELRLTVVLFSLY